MSFDPQRRLVMATFKTVLGHNLPAGTELTIVEEPSARGEVDLALAARLWNSQNAAYLEDHRPTPVETPEQERARLSHEALRDAEGGEPVAPSDLVTWPADDQAAGKRAGQPVTKPDLLLIAGREGVVVETDDNKPDLIRKILQHRATAATGNLTEAGTGEAPDTATGATGAATGAGTGAGTGGGATGDSHGAAGEGSSEDDGA